MLLAIFLLLFVGCNFAIKADSVQIRTPGLSDTNPKNYPNAITCVWTFELQTPNRKYTLFFSKFSLDSSDTVV